VRLSSTNFHIVQRKRLRERLIERPELLSVPTLIIWLIVNVPRWEIFSGQSLALLLVRIGLLMGPTFNSTQIEIFPLTYVLAWTSIIIALFLFRSKVRLNWIRTLILSFSFPFAFIAFFEEIWQNLWTARGLPPPLSNEIWMLSWLIFGFSTIQFWRFSKKSLLALFVIAIGFGFWVITGYQQLAETGSLLVPLLNWATKLVTFVLFAFLLLDGVNGLKLAPQDPLPQLEIIG